MCLLEHTAYTIFAFQSYYKQPRLRKGSVPSQFPWTETLDNVTLHEQNLVNKIEQCEEDIQAIQDIQEAANKPNQFLFVNLVACATLQVPINWTRRTFICEELKLNHLSQYNV